MPSAPALLCYDGSPPARGAIEAAGELLGGGPALVLTVWEPYKPPLHAPVGGAIALATGFAKEFDEAAVDIARRTADEGAEIARAAGFDAKPLIVRGKPRDAIVDAAQEHETRVVVMGRRGQGGAESVFYGSVSTAVLHRCPVPVLVVRGPRG
jgi:nucleotide-binding universal stress UspA family protein